MTQQQYLAAIDLGSNSFHMVVARIEDGHVHILDRLKEMVRLRGGLGPALTSKALNTKSKEFITTTILEGRTGTPMPPWKLFLSRDEASWMAAKLKKGIEE